MAMGQRKRFLILGRVQGVGFRWFAQQAARKRGVVGWVKNQPDGSVLCEAQGPALALQDLLSDLRQGPGFSRVEEVRIEDLPPRGQGEAEASFGIR